MYLKKQLYSLLCLGLALSTIVGCGPVVHALAGKSSASVFSPVIENPCIADWQGPSADNSFDCDGETFTEWMLENNMWQFGIPFAIGFLLFCPGCCILLCGRYCCGCCGSSKQRPGHICCPGGSDLDNLTEGERAQMYTPCCINTTKCMSFVVALMGLAGLILNVLGGVRISQGMGEVADSFEELVNWFLQLIAEVKEGMKDPVTGTYPTGYDFSMFDDAATQVRDVKQTYYTDGIGTISGTVGIASMIPAFISILPAILLLLPAIAAVCNIRRCLPTWVVVLSFPFQFIYFFIVTLLLFFLLPIDLVCNDIEAQPHEKSVMQWYVVPYCDAESPFESLIENVEEMETDSATEGCQKLLEVCSTTPIWDFTDPQKVFYCNITDAATECRTLEDIVSKVDGMVIKTGAPETCGGNASGCTLRQCAIACDDNDARSSAKEAVDALSTAQRVKNVFETVLLPWLACSRLLNKLLGLGPRQMCSTLRGGVTYFKDGSILIAAGCVVGMIVSMLGEKRFFNRDKLIEEDILIGKIGGPQEQQQQHPIIVAIDPAQHQMEYYDASKAPPPYAAAYPSSEYVVKAEPPLPPAPVEHNTYVAGEQTNYTADTHVQAMTYSPEDTEMQATADADAYVSVDPNVPTAYAYADEQPAMVIDDQPVNVTTEQPAYATLNETEDIQPITNSTEYTEMQAHTTTADPTDVPHVYTTEAPFSPADDNQNNHFDS